MSQLLVPLKETEDFKALELIPHPTFGKLEVCGIFEIEPEKYEIYCTLLDYNNTVKAFDYDELKMLKLGKGKLKAVK